MERTSAARGRRGPARRAPRRAITALAAAALATGGSTAALAGTASSDAPARIERSLSAAAGRVAALRNLAALRAASGPLSAHGACATPVEQSVRPFQDHLRYAHIERGLRGQVEDITHVDDWVKAHTTLASLMAAPPLDGAVPVPGKVLDPFFQHLKYAHLERSPLHQVDDIKHTDQWVETHKVLGETMAAPATEALAGCSTGQAVAPPADAAAAAVTPVSAPQACSDALGAAVEPFEQHMKVAHLERSAGDQVNDLKATDQWLKTHAELFKAMGAPVVEGSGSIAGGASTPFMEHLKVAHIERGVPGQIEDIVHTDQWAKTHTVLLEAMTEKAMDALAGGCAAPAPQSPMPMPHGQPPAPAPQAAAGGSTVMVHRNAFSPSKVTVGKGGTVTWTNHDPVPHTITGGALKSGTLDHNATFSHTFGTAGSFPYYCAVHPDMKGVVEVTG